MSETIIDAHVHAGRADKLTASWEAFEDVEISLRRMDAAGIDRAVILPIGSDGFVRANRETAETVARHPDRLMGFAKVSQTADAGRIDRMLDEAFGELGLGGLKLHGLPNREIMDALARHRRPLLVDVLGDVPPLRYAAEGYPDVPIIIAHMGRFCSTDLAVRVQTMWLAARYPNVYFDTSSVMDHASLETAVAEGLAGKMIFGSDGPVLHCAVELARVCALPLSEPQRRLVLGGTICELIGTR